MSGPRLEPMKPADLDDDQRRLYHAVLASPRAQGPTRNIILREDGSIGGPFDAWLRTPKLGEHLERAGMAFREDTVLSPAARELATLVVARAWNAEFEWWVHGMVARREGVPEAVIDAIGHGKTPVFEDPAFEAAYAVAYELVYQRRVETSTLDRAKEALGERAVVEVVTLVGFYQLVSGVLETFHPPGPSGDFEVVGPPTSGQAG